MNLSAEDALMLWNDVVEMAHDCEDTSVVPWLERLTPVSFEDNTLTVSTRQNWTARKTMGEYRETIEGLLREITLEKVALQVIVSTSGGAPATAAPAAEQTAPQPVEQQIAPSSAPAPQAEDGADQLSAAARAGAAAAAGRSISSLPRRRTVLSPIAQTTATEAASEAPTTSDTTVGTVVSDQLSSPVPADEPAPDEPILSETDTDLRFDTYIVGEANKIAYNMAHAVAEQPGTLANLNPLFIWGPSGNGKTHLLRSIENYLAEHQPRMNVLFVNANEFVENYIDDIRNKRLRGTEVLKAYRNVDVLLVDDVQFFEAKQESVSTFFDIFNQLKDHGKQIVLAADTPPDYLALDDRMKTRFGSGLVVDIKAPTYEMKRSILKSYYDRYRLRMDWCAVDIPPRIFDLMAQLAPSNPRTMQGLMTSVIIKANENPDILSPEGIRAAVNDLFKSNEVVTIDSIIRAVSEEYEVREEDLKGSSRKKNISEARQVAMWMARTLTESSYEDIGRSLGNRDHSTVYYGISTVEKRTLEDKGYLYKLERLKEAITKAC